MERLREEMEEVVFEFSCGDGISLSEIMRVEGSIGQLEGGS